MPDFDISQEIGGFGDNSQRAKVFAARAEAAYEGYASTRNVQTPEKTRSILHTSQHFPFFMVNDETYPVPNKTLPIIGTIQCTLRYVVHPNQNRPTGTITPPKMAGGSLNSGSGF